MRFFKRQLTTILLGWALILTSCSKGEKPKEPHLFPVETGNVLQKDTPIYINAVGNVAAKFTIDVRSQVTGILKEVHIKEGQDVGIGQLIYTIDPAPYLAELEKAKAQLRVDEARLKLAADKVMRYTSLAEQDFISQLQYDELVTNVELAKATVDVDRSLIETAQINLDYCYIRSPVDGKISYNEKDPGNLITANSEDALTSIRQMTPALVDFTISQKDFLKLQREHRNGQTNFIFNMLDTDGKEVKKEGVVYFIDNNFNLNSGSILLRGTIENKDYSLWPGEFGKVQIILKTVKDAILVPIAAIQIGQKGPYVYVLQPDNTVSTKNVHVLEKADDYVVVEAGLKQGDQVITNGQVNLREGASVQVKNPENNASDKGEADKKKSAKS